MLAHEDSQKLLQRTVDATEMERVEAIGAAAKAAIDTRTLVDATATTARIGSRFGCVQGCACGHCCGDHHY